MSELQDALKRLEETGVRLVEQINKRTPKNEEQSEEMYDFQVALKQAKKMLEG